MKRLDFPVKLPEGRAPVMSLGVISTSLDELVARFGQHHAEETDPYLVPGPTKYWGFEVESGQRVVIELACARNMADIYADPPDLDAAVRGLGLHEESIIWRAPKR